MTEYWPDALVEKVATSICRWGDKLARAIDATVRWGLVIPAALLVCGLIRLLLLIPGFTFDTSQDDPT